MIPELASLVSQKFTFSVSINQKNLTHRNVSFQRNSIVTLFGKQNYIPKPADLHPECSKESSEATSPGSTNCDNVGAPVATKRARLDRKVIPCRRSLDFGNGSTRRYNCSGEDQWI